jgi:thymidylate synthase ThyX
MEKNAQMEIRKYAEIIGNKIVSKWVPITWKAFQEYILGSTQFSNKEMEILKLIFSQKKKEAKQFAEEMGWIKYKDDQLKFNIERYEFEQKLDTLNIPHPW